MFDLQVVATLPSLRYYDQQALDDAVKAAWNLHDDGTLDWGVRRWTDTDEAEAWSKPGDPILPSELAQWADLVVVAPCSADMLAKIVAGFADNLAVSSSVPQIADSSSHFCAPSLPPPLPSFAPP
jgi:phosphopantothenoylcysteine decarboxylase